MGEPFVTLCVPDEIEQLLRGHGFDHIFHFRPQETRARYFNGRADGEIGWAQLLVAATVPADSA